MTLEATLERIAVALETIAKNGGTLAQATAELGKPEAAAPAPKPGKGKKDEPAAAPTAQAPAAPVPSPSAPAPAPSEPAGPTWADVLAKIQALNKSTVAGHGRDGVIKVMGHFGLDPKPVDQGGKGDTVPKLQALGKNADILAFVDSLMAPAAPPAAEPDLGI